MRNPSRPYFWWIMTRDDAFALTDLLYGTGIELTPGGTPDTATVSITLMARQALQSLPAGQDGHVDLEGPTFYWASIPYTLTQVN